MTGRIKKQGGLIYGYSESYTGRGEREREREREETFRTGERNNKNTHDP
jgi:hypothetical protein